MRIEDDHRSASQSSPLGLVASPILAFLRRATSLALAARADIVVQYALLLENATTAAKVGFFLEQHKDRLMVEESHLDRLRARRPREPHYFARDRRGGRLVSEWNLIVPLEVLERSWAEVT